MTLNHNECAASVVDTTPRRVPRVLCIDDDPDILNTLKLRLRNYDVEVLEATHGMHGLWLAAHEDLDVIVTDLRMPQGEGEHVLECLKRNPETTNIPVIVLSGKPGSDLDGRLRLLGAATFVRKPIHFSELLRVLGEYITLRERDYEDEDPFRQAPTNESRAIR